jgi:hypothetical protein
LSIVKLRFAEFEARDREAPLTILLIAIAHILPILLCRFLTESRPAMVYTALVCLAIAAGFGNPTYAPIDSAAVLLGLYFLWPPQPSSLSPPKLTVQAPLEKIASPPKSTDRSEALSPAQWVDLSPKVKKRPWGRYVGGAILLWVLWLVFSQP